MQIHLPLRVSGLGSSSRYLRITADPHLTYATAKGHTYNLKMRYLNINRIANGTDPNAVSHAGSSRITSISLNGIASWYLLPVLLSLWVSRGAIYTKNYTSR
jgi:cytochrome c biogenesis protein ResB